MVMKKLFAGIAAVALTLSCNYAAQADPHPPQLRDHKFNATNPVTKDGVTTFTIRNHECSNVKYGDGRGESDCYNGNVRSTLGRTSEERLGETVEYSFDIFVGEEFRYSGYNNSHAYGFLGVDNIRLRSHDSRLRIASWEGPFLHNFLYMLKLDSTRGVYFLDSTCFGPDRFGKWNTFSMKVRWASDKRGWIRVECNGETIHLAEGIATNQAPHCYITNQCEPGKKKNPQRVLFLLGPVMSGFGFEWKKYGKASQFTEIQEDGITIRMRNIEIRKGVDLYGPEDVEIVRELQAHLNKLGCDVGPADGIAGPKTRATALACRDFTDAEIPTELNVLTAPKILAVYREKYPVN